MKLAGRQSALTPPIPLLYSTDRSKAIVSLTLCCFVVYSTRRFVLCLTLCYFVLLFFSPFSMDCDYLVWGRES